MNSFELQIGTRFVFGLGALQRIGEELESLGARRIMLHYGEGDYLIPLLQEIRKILDSASIEVFEFDGVQANPRLSLVREGIRQARDQHIDVVVAVGGGSAIDSAKAIALGAASECDVWDYFRGAAVPRHTLPVVAVVTIPAAGSESSQVAVLSDDKTKSKLLVSHPIMRPAVALMDPGLTCTVPIAQTANGIVDIFSHVCERYFNESAEFGVIDRMCEGVLKSIVYAGKTLANHPEDLAMRSEIMWISTIAQNGTLGVGREQDWSTHLLANELSALYDCVHGQTISAIMPAWMVAARSANTARFARFAEKVFNVCDNNETSCSQAAIVQTVNFFRTLGMPCSMKELGVRTDRIEEMLDAIPFEGSDQAIGAVRRLNREACKHIYLQSAQGADLS
nr:iron-containing alcohol dehydrogenase [Collinsella urealyticum]